MSVSRQIKWILWQICLAKVQRRPTQERNINSNPAKGRINITRKENMMRSYLYLAYRLINLSRQLWSEYLSEVEDIHKFSVSKQVHCFYEFLGAIASPIPGVGKEQPATLFCGDLKGLKQIIYKKQNWWWLHQTFWQWISFKCSVSRRGDIGPPKDDQRRFQI